MNILENEIFKKSVVDFKKIEEYGFQKVDKYYVLEKVFMNNQFKAVIKVDLKGYLTGKVYDMETNLEYTNIRLNNVKSFSAVVREEYKNILENIANCCYIKRDFIFEQSNRIANYIKGKYNVSSEFLWDLSPDVGVFRNKNSLKWFGIIMHINKNRIMNQEGDVEVINVKIDVNSDNLIKKKGFYKAYHMNKKSWITMVLDNTLKDEEIIKYIDISYNLVNK